MQLHAKNYDITQITEQTVNKTAMAVIFHFSKLTTLGEQIDIPLNVMYDRLKNCHGNIVVLPSQDVAVIFHVYDQDMLFDLIYQMRYMFSDDPLSYQADGSENPNFASVFYSNALPRFWQILSGDVLSHISLSNHNDNVPQSYDVLDKIAERIEEAFVAVNWTTVVSEYDVYHVTNMNAPLIKRWVVDEHALYNQLHSIGAGQLMDNPWKAWRQPIIDMRMLINVLQNNYNQPCLLPLSLNTITSHDFTLFDQGMIGQQKNQMIIVLHISDVMHSLDKYRQVIHQLRQQGYKIAIEGLVLHECIMLNLTYFDVDLFVVQCMGIIPEALGAVRNRLIITHATPLEQQQLRELGVVFYQIG